MRRVSGLCVVLVAGACVGVADAAPAVDVPTIPACATTAVKPPPSNLAAASAAPRDQGHSLGGATYVTDFGHHG